MRKYNLFTFAICLIGLNFGYAYISHTYYKRNVTIDNFGLSGNTLKKISNSTFESCFLFCASNPFCLRFAFHTDTGCWLYKEEIETDGDNTKAGEGWKSFEMKEYVSSIKLHHISIKLDWDQAVTECRTRGMYLAILSNQITFSAAQKYILTNPDLTETDGLWIGLRKENNNFTWLDGTVGYDLPWDGNWPKEGAKQCVSIHKKRFLLRAVMCRSLRYILCREH